jgi:hypothetical protein
MHKDLLNNNDDNLYKYLVIIGLSLLLLVPIVNGSKTELLMKQMDNEFLINNLIKKNNEQISKNDDFQKKLSGYQELLDKEITDKISELNIYNLSGKKIDNIAELIDIYSYSIDIIEKNILDNNVIMNTLFQIYGYVGSIEGFQEKLDSLLLREKEIGKLIDEWKTKIASLTDEINMYTEENTRFFAEADRLIHEKEKIELQKSHILVEDNYILFSRIIGIAMVILGFILWYLKIQRYRDIEYSNLGLSTSALFKYQKSSSEDGENQG